MFASFVLRREALKKKASAFHFIATCEWGPWFNASASSEAFHSFWHFSAFQAISFFLSSTSSLPPMRSSISLCIFQIFSSWKKNDISSSSRFSPYKYPGLPPGFHACCPAIHCGQRLGSPHDVFFLAVSFYTRFVFYYHRARLSIYRRHRLGHHRHRHVWMDMDGYGWLQLSV